jgi:hypothetical protein
LQEYLALSFLASVLLHSNVTLGLPVVFACLKWLVSRCATPHIERRCYRFDGQKARPRNAFALLRRIRRTFRTAYRCEKLSLPPVQHSLPKNEKTNWLYTAPPQKASLDN